jgi:hypothetical protein
MFTYPTTPGTGRRIAARGSASEPTSDIPTKPPGSLRRPRSPRHHKETE